MLYKTQLDYSYTVGNTVIKKWMKQNTEQLLAKI